VYRFLLSPRWLGLAVLMAVAAATMVWLGLWQLDRYHYRDGINTRIDAATVNAPLALGSVVAPPVGASVGAAPPPEASYTRVTATGRFDQTHEILARSRTVGGNVGFEIITPLVLPDGSAVLVDRGWLPPAASGAAALPAVPPAPTGDVTVVGRVHAPELLAPSLPYPVYGAYVTLESPADPALVPIAPSYENAAMNAGYVVQWWLFAALPLVGYVVLAVREARARSAPAPVSPALGPLINEQGAGGPRGTAPGRR
jgi:cytochrome oxidase assembly protein ShyY1